MKYLLSHTPLYSVATIIGTVAGGYLGVSGDLISGAWENFILDIILISGLVTALSTLFTKVFQKAIHKKMRESILEILMELEKEWRAQNEKTLPKQGPDTTEEDQ